MSEKRKYKRVKHQTAQDIGDQRQLRRTFVHSPPDSFEESLDPVIHQLSFRKPPKHPYFSDQVDKELYQMISPTGSINTLSKKWYIDNSEKIINQVLYKYESRIVSNINVKGKEIALDITIRPFQFGDYHSLDHRQINSIVRNLETAWNVESFGDGDFVRSGKAKKLRDQGGDILDYYRYLTNLIKEKDQLDDYSIRNMLTERGRDKNKILGNTFDTDDIQKAIDNVLDTQSQLLDETTLTKLTEAMSLEGKRGKLKRLNYKRKIEGLKRKFLEKYKDLEVELSNLIKLDQLEPKIVFSNKEIAEFNPKSVEDLWRVDDQFQATRESVTKTLGKLKQQTVLDRASGEKNPDDLLDLLDTIDDTIDQFDNVLEGTQTAESANDLVPSLYDDPLFDNFDKKTDLLRSLLAKFVTKLQRSDHVAKKLVEIDTTEKSTSKLFNEKFVKENTKITNVHNQLKKRRTYRKTSYDPINKKYNVSLSGGNGYEVKILSGNNLIKDPSITLNTKAKIIKVNEKYRINNLEVTKEEREAIKAMIDALNDSGFDGKQIINDYFLNQVDFIGNEPGILLEDIRRRYERDVSEVMNNVEVVNIDFDRYSWSFLSSQDIPGAYIPRAKFDFRNVIQPEATMVEIIQYGQSIGLFKVIDWDTEEFDIPTPSRLFIEGSSKALLDLEFGDERQRVELLTEIQKALGIQSETIITGFDERNLFYQEQAMRVKMDRSWTESDVVLFSDFFKIPLGNSDSDRKQRNDILGSLEDNFFLDLLVDRPGLDGVLFEHSTKDDIKTKEMRSMISNISFGSELRTAIDEYERAVDRKDQDLMLLASDNLTKTLDEGKFKTIQDKINRNIDYETSKNYFIQLLMSTNSQINYRTAETQWFAVTDNPNIEIIGKKTETMYNKDTRDRVLLSSQKASFADVKNYIKREPDDDLLKQILAFTSQTGVESNRSGDVNKALEQLITVGQLKADASAPIVKTSETNQAVQFELLKEIYLHLLFRPKVKDGIEQFGYDLPNAVREKAAFESDIYQKTADLLNQDFDEALDLAINRFEFAPDELAKLNITKKEAEETINLDGLFKDDSPDPQVQEIQKTMTPEKVEKVVDTILEAQDPKAKEQIEKERYVDQVKMNTINALPKKDQATAAKTLNVDPGKVKVGHLASELESISTSLSKGVVQYDDLQLTNQEKRFLDRTDRRLERLDGSIETIQALNDIKNQNKLDENLMFTEIVRADKIVQEQLDDINDVLPQDRIKREDFTKLGADTDSFSDNELKKRGATQSNIDEFERDFPNLDQQEMLDMMRPLLLSSNKFKQMATEVLPKTSVTKTPKTKVISFDSGAVADLESKKPKRKAKPKAKPKKKKQIPTQSRKIKPKSTLSKKGTNN